MAGDAVVHTVVTYMVKPESISENCRLIEDVFQEIWSSGNNAFSYQVFEDSGKFIHIHSTNSSEKDADLTKFVAFRIFRKDLDWRCIEQPRVAKAALVGAYRSKTYSDPFHGKGTQICGS